MANHKWRRPQRSRAGCKMCKPWKTGFYPKHHEMYEKHSDHRRRIFAMEEEKMARVWINEQGEEEELLEIPFRSILDRTENEMYFDLGPKQVWIPNQYVGHIDELRGVIEIAPEFAEENELA